MMKFVGEHLLPGQIGQFFVILSLVAALIATISFFKASNITDALQKNNWLKLARTSFYVQVAGSFVIFTVLLYICSNHLFEYMYAYKHASLELEYKYLLSCIWEGQEGSFLLWTIWHGVIGILLIKKANDWEAPVMTVVSFAQFFLMLMILGVYFGNIKIGNSPFSLTRNEISAPIFNRPDYMNFIKDGLGLNVLLRNYWMVIHPPILFLGFASTIIPFAYAYAGIQTKRYADWVKPALPYTLMGICILGVGIMMGGKWAYESLNFGGYWAWDPVENASLVPWLLMVAGMHTMVIYKATGHSLRASYLFMILTFVFILYSTFLTRTGVLGDTSVHSFTETGEDITFTIFGHLFSFKAMNGLILSYLLVFTIPSLWLFIKNYKKIPTIYKEEATNSREFWMYIGSLVFFLTAIFIIAKTSVPVYNKVFGKNIAPPEDVEFSYNKIIVLVAIIIGFLTAITQYLKYKSTEKSYLFKKIALPTVIAIAIMAVIVFAYPFTYYKQGAGFLGAIYVAAFAVIYSVVANASYIWSVQKGNIMKAGSPIAHAGFALMIVGILISSANKKVISSSNSNGITLPVSGKDPMTKQQDNPRENLTLLRQVPATLANYSVTYLKDSAGHEKGRNFYKLNFVRKNEDGTPSKENFVLEPDVYVMKDNNMSSNPDTKSYLLKDVFTYVSYAINKNAEVDTAQFKEVKLNVGDTAFYSNGFMTLNNVVKNPTNSKFKYSAEQVALMADIKITSKDSLHFAAAPLIMIDSLGITNADDTVYAQNIFVRFMGVDEDKKIRIGIKESDKLIDYVTVKAYIFPLINLVWIGLIIMAAGIVLSMLQRGKFTRLQSGIILFLSTAFVFYMFLLANA
ncbi:cytochrome c biogenesis protein CcsA [Ferruginibacter yonginensis]|uniref:Cytochrome c biogenesis protein CcsA n=1 Tax=Ferruginibacter yonginensis TaxID=1310416 RepID=A0ABV8QPJ7_9BACT